MISDLAEKLEKSPTTGQKIEQLIFPRIITIPKNNCADQLMQRLTQPVISIEPKKIGLAMFRVRVVREAFPRAIVSFPSVIS